MIIIGGLGSIMGTLMGTAFMVLLPESMEWLSVALRGSPIDQFLGLKNNIAFLREMAIGMIIIVFLVFEPDGLCASMAADQGVLETLPVLALRSERDGQRRPQLILLDEPMAGMNFEEKEDMARYIVDLNEEFGMTVMMIEHDMGVVMDISHRVMVLDFGRKIAEGDPASVLADPHVKRAYLGEEDEVLVDPDDTPAPRESAA